MPTYDFVCDDCGQHFEKVVSFTQKSGVQRCPKGHSHVHRQYTPPAIVFKGSGFYKTDHRPKEKAAAD